MDQGYGFVNHFGQQRNQKYFLNVKISLKVPSCKLGTMPNCCVPDCKNTAENGFLLRCFPRNAALRAKWAKNINRPDWVPNHCHRICEVHFAPNMWEKTRVDGTRKLKFNAVPTIFKGRVIEQPDSTNITIPPSETKEQNDTESTTNEKAIVKILPPANSKNAKPIILPASIFENQSNPPSTIIVNTEGKIINTQPISSVTKTASILKPQMKSATVSSAPMIIATNATSSILKDQIKSASNQSPIVIPPSASILKPQFQITSQPISSQLPKILQSKSPNNHSILIPVTRGSVKKLCAQNTNIQQTRSVVPSIIVPKKKIVADSESMAVEELSDIEMDTAPVGIVSSRAQMKKIADDRFEKMDKLLLKQLRLNNALRKKLSAANHQLNLVAKEKSSDYKVYLKDIFTEDQMRAIELRHTNPKSITAWSHKTMIKAIKLKECCGTRGYEELLKQNMPLPSLRTISRWCTQRNIPIP